MFACFNIFYPNPGLKHQKFNIFPPASAFVLFQVELPFSGFAISASTYN